jgi:hypothetical protein
VGRTKWQPLPCPFCQAIPTVEPWHGGKPTKRIVSCQSEGCYVNPMVTGETHNEAVARWNIRLEPEEADRG